MRSTVTLPMIDGTQVVVPDSLDLITPYVLREQQDWFEDEIKLVRQLLQPGQAAIDIGANYGLYTLSMANAVGPSGHVWAFEPASSTASLLAESLAINGFDHVTLERCALSAEEGTAQLSMHSQAELNALVRGDAESPSSETVRVVTLDGYREHAGWRDIDFVKIDAEGEEINIIGGGREFFATHSPLVQYEVKSGRQADLSLAHAFAEIGYDSYRLVPGLDLLAPFDADEPADRFLLNLFACKPDRAARLAKDGWLVDPTTATDARADAADDPAFHWRATLATLPYGRRLAATWEKSATAGEAEPALALFSLSQDTSYPPAERVRALESSYRRYRKLVAAQPTHPRLASLARIARAFGARVVALDALAEICKGVAQDGRVELSEPFLAPGPRFDSVDPGTELGKWVFIAAVEELERAVAFSSFYSGTSARDRLETICRSDFAGADMHRRLSLLQQRFGTSGMNEELPVGQ